MEKSEQIQEKLPNEAPSSKKGVLCKENLRKGNQNIYFRKLYILAMNRNKEQQNYIEEQLKLIQNLKGKLASKCDVMKAMEVANTALEKECNEALTAAKCELEMLNQEKLKWQVEADLNFEKIVKESNKALTVAKRELFFLTQEKMSLQDEVDINKDKIEDLEMYIEKFQQDLSMESTMNERLILEKMNFQDEADINKDKIEDLEMSMDKFQQDANRELEKLKQELSMKSAVTTVSTRFSKTGKRIGRPPKEGTQMLINSLGNMAVTASTTSLIQEKIQVSTTAIEKKVKQSDDALTVVRCELENLNQEEMNWQAEADLNKAKIEDLELQMEEEKKQQRKEQKEKRIRQETIQNIRRKLDSNFDVIEAMKVENTALEKTVEESNKALTVTERELLSLTTEKMSLQVEMDENKDKIEDLKMFIEKTQQDAKYELEKQNQELSKEFAMNKMLFQEKMNLQVEADMNKAKIEYLEKSIEARKLTVDTAFETYVKEFNEALKTASCELEMLNQEEKMKWKVEADMNKIKIADLEISITNFRSNSKLELEKQKQELSVESAMNKMLIQKKMNLQLEADMNTAKIDKLEKFIEKAQQDAKCELEKQKQEKINLKKEVGMKNSIIEDLEESLEKAQQDAKRDLEKMKQELSLKSAMTNINTPEQKESDVKARKITNKLVVKIFNVIGEDLESLMSLKPEELISRYEQVTNSDKVEEISENLADLKNKLNLQNIQKEAYEKQHLEMMEVLNIPGANRSFANILPSVIALKESLNKVQDQNEIEHYSHAQVVIESQQD